MNAEYFIEQVEKAKKESASNPDARPYFEFKYNPFRFDVLGKPIEFGDDFKLPKSVRLVPDIETMREMPW